MGSLLLCSKPGSKTGLTLLGIIQYLDPRVVETPHQSPGLVRVVASSRVLVIFGVSLLYVLVPTLMW